MRPATRRWDVAEGLPLGGLPPVLGRILAGRGFDSATAAAWLDGSDSFHDPFALAGMPEAVITVGIAVREKRRIAVYGDYDADGVTACAMLTRALRRSGADVLPYIPNRMTEGYGLHAAALEDLASRGVDCVITVDCGTSSVEVAQGRPPGMRLVITDHHLPLAPDGSPPALAPADALVNPKRPDCSYPFDGLAGAGVAWKLLSALESEAVVAPGCAEEALGLAALGTVADMMPLRGENRAIVARGLAALSESPPLGLRVLCELAGVRLPLRASDLAFGVAPRINAAGRMEDAKLALALCLCEDEDEARQLAAQLCAHNADRQRAVSAALAEAEERLPSIDDGAPAIVLGDPGWPMGIVGLVAGRLAERYARPAFVVCLDPEEAKGSARSVRGLHVVRVLDAARSVLRRYGGHAAAAGFSLDAGNFEEFARLVAAGVAEQLGGAAPERIHHVDAEVSVADLTPALCRELAALEPCGQGNPEPLLALSGCRVLATSTFGAEGQHLRLTLCGADGGLVEAIAFNKPGLAAHLPRGRWIDACFAVEADAWEGMERVRLRLRDLRPMRVLASTPATVAAVA
jgi:single-stranded-DNA-specific exonuclease